VLARGYGRSDGLVTSGFLATEMISAGVQQEGQAVGGSNEERMMRELCLITLFMATTACGGGQAGVDPRELLSREETSVAEGAEGTGDSGTATAGSGEAFDLRQCTQENPCRGPFPPGVGFCAREDIIAVVGAAADSIRFCYEHHVQSDPDLAGAISTRWTIELDGTVSSVESTTETAGLEAVIPCVGLVIGRLQFAPPNGGQCVIDYPFIFRTQ
jgi:hypothetical protein